MALRPLLRVLSRVRKDQTWGDLKSLLNDRLFTKQFAAKSQDPLPPVLFQMATGYWLSEVIYVAAKLGIADLLESGPQSVVELAATTCSDSRSLFRVLRALSNFGVFTQNDDGYFALSRVGNALRTNVPGSLRRAVISLGEIHYRACGELLHAVQTGSPAFNQVYGTSLFEHLQQNPQDSVAFNRGMTDLAYLLAQAVLLAYDFSDISSIVDVGGGEGKFLRSILELYPALTGIVFDSSKDLLPRPKEERCSFIVGNLFDSVPEKAEV